MPDCFGPLGGVLAFCGALGLILTVFGGGYVLADLATKRDDTPVLFPIFVLGIVLLVLALVFGFVNQAFVPPVCSHV